MKIKKRSLAAQLADEGLTDTTVKRTPVNVPVTVLFGGFVFTRTQDLLYTAKGGLRGSAKQARSGGRRR